MADDVFVVIILSIIMLSIACASIVLLAILIIIELTRKGPVEKKKKGVN